LRQDSAVLSLLGARLPFEIAVGLNGVCWLRSGSPRETVLALNAITGSFRLPRARVKRFVEGMLRRL
jgi:exosome complex RNA-binding protein Rrp4